MLNLGFTRSSKIVPKQIEVVKVFAKTSVNGVENLSDNEKAAHRIYDGIVLCST